MFLKKTHVECLLLDYHIYIYKWMNKQTNNCVARVLNTNVEQIIRANYKYIWWTNKTNTSKQLLVSCLHIHQAYNMWDVEHTFHLIYVTTNCCIITT